MLPKLYARALVHIARRGESSAAELLNHLTAVLDRRGHKKILPRILKEVRRLANREVERKYASFTVAKASDTQHFATNLERFLEEVSDGGVPVRTVVDPRIVGGWIGEISGQRIDRSFRRALLDLYSAFRVKNHG